MKQEKADVIENETKQIVNEESKTDEKESEEDDVMDMDAILATEQKK